ncbi:hypothetical protein MKK55_26770 [Methylobacterium sp. J-059]|uniref:hypothetical protein n=1 Tax=Methylobacterium sp. J-059 TaxID=2836643 RepID=UPI001FBA911E|nr:hypothetical protein [Methylobacterium sp. J-059]MCJ2042523.1 hypothetical protein [Methylobacterium sp. J-059]
MIAKAALAVTLLVISTAVCAKEIIRCTAKGQPDVTMTLNAERKFDYVLSCISGRFIADMTPCAPNGGFGLSSPTGTASLARVVERWQDYGDHMGGITGYTSNATQVHFDGGFFSPRTNNTPIHWSEQWSFTANRLTGKAMLIQENKPDVEYICTKAYPRF